MSWNVGSAVKHSAAIFDHLATHQPHLLCLQEARLGPGSLRALQAEARVFGYSLHASHGGELACFVLNGVNFVPLQAVDGDHHFNLARYGLEISGERILVRHVHGHPSSSEARQALLNHLASDDAGNLIISIGDFNAHLQPQGDMHDLWPSEHTFRPNGYSDRFVSTPDGAYVSTAFHQISKVSALPAVPGLQHRPFELSVAMRVLLRTYFAWNRGVGGEARPWTHTEKVDFAAQAAALRSRPCQNSLDDLWSRWLALSFGPSPFFQQSRHWGAWSTGDDTAEIARIFARVRRLRIRCTAQADSEAKALLDKAAAAIEAHRAQRLDNWIERVRTRSGAAQWVKRKLLERVAPCFDSFAEANINFRDAALKAAQSFAARWNAGVSAVSLDGSQSCSLGGSLPARNSIAAAPPPRQCSQIDLSLFGNIPPLPPSAGWTAADILSFMPKGAPGVDGITTAWLRQCHSDSLDALCSLFDLADCGQTPSCWAQARTTLIPKSADSPPGDLRPITVLSITYRIWGRRHASRVNSWMETWAAEGLLGALPHRTAAAAAHRATVQIDRAKAKLRDRLFVLTLDQSKCFDTISLDTLETVANHLGATPLQTAVANYRKLSRHMFLGGEPTPFVIHSHIVGGLAGIPQGCPLAPILCNLLGHAWILQMRRTIPHATCLCYLDDRLLLADSWSDLDKGLAATILFDKATGPTLNHQKCNCCQVVGSRRPALKKPAHVLAGITTSKCIKYLGVDLIAQGGTASKTAATRTDDCMHRLQLIGKLPSIQRDALVGDAISALYLDGGTLLTPSQLLRLSRAAARALNGNKHPRSQVTRSREAMHLVGAGLVRTCPIYGCFASFVRQLWRLLATGGLTHAVWASLYANRSLCISGLPRFIRGPLHITGISWPSPFKFTCGPRSFHIVDSYADIGSTSWAEARRLLATAPFKKKMHELRSFLRYAHARRMATIRPRDYLSLRAGWNEDPTIRTTAYTAWHHPGGRSLLTAGIWTRSMIVTAFGSGSLMCPRCSLAAENREHRLWECRANGPFWNTLLVELRATFPGRDVAAWLRTLPLTTRRCGLFPADFHCPARAARAVVHYLADVNHHANECVGAAAAGRALPVATPGAFWEKAAACLQSREHCPARRSTRADIHQRSIASAPGAAVNKSTFSIDGSYDSAANSAGWGVILLRPSGELRFCCGPLVPGTGAEFFHVRRCSNNTAELCAISAAAAWCHQLLPGPDSTDFLYDSIWAMRTATGAWRPRRNADEVDTARRALERLRDAGVSMQAHHVRAHRGHFLNELADCAAKMGSQGSRLWNADILALKTTSETLNIGILSHRSAAQALVAVAA